MSPHTSADEKAIRDEFYRLGDGLMAWVASYNANGKTYGMFWADFKAEAAEFERFLERPDLPKDLLGQAQFVYADVEHAGFVPGAVSEDLTYDDLVFGHQMPGGRPPNGLTTPPREAIEVMLADIEHGNPGARPTTLAERIAQGRTHFLTLKLSDADRAWVEAELRRMEAG